MLQYFQHLKSPFLLPLNRRDSFVEYRACRDRPGVCMLPCRVVSPRVFCELLLSLSFPFRFPCLISVPNVMHYVVSSSPRCTLAALQHYVIIRAAALTCTQHLDVWHIMWHRLYHHCPYNGGRARWFLSIYASKMAWLRLRLSNNLPTRQPFLGNVNVLNSHN